MHYFLSLYLFHCDPCSTQDPSVITILFLAFVLLLSIFDTNSIVSFNMHCFISSSFINIITPLEKHEEWFFFKMR
jgi:hypothetical protein